MAVAGEVRAQSSQAPTPPQFADSTQAGPARGTVVGDTTASPRRAPQPARGFDAPRWVMVRSALLPAWGQIHNRAWLKAALVAGAELTLIARLVDDTRALDRLEEDIRIAQGRLDDEAEARAVDAYNARLDRRTARAWLLGGLLAYALTDAYVDAHLRNFDVEFGPDPAAESPDGSVRVSARWTF